MMAYGSAHLGKSLFWYAGELLFAYFLTELGGLKPSQMAAALALGFACSALIDVLVGRGLRNFAGSARVAAQVQFIGAAVSSLALMLVLATPWVGQEGRFVYAVTASVLFRLAFAFYDIPQNALMAMATTDVVIRYRLASVRIWCSGLAMLLIGAAIGPLIAGRQDAGSPSLLLGLALFCAAMGIGSAYALARVVRPEVPSTALSNEARAGATPSHHQAVMILMAVGFVASLFTPLFGKLEPYFADQILGSALWGGAIMISMAVGVSAGQPVWSWWGLRSSRRYLMVMNAGVQMAGLGLFALSGAIHPVAALIGAFLFGVGNGGVGMALWAAFSEAVAGRPSRQITMAYGVFAAANKVGLAVGVVVLGAVLNGLPPDSAGGVTILHAMTLIPAVGAMMVLVLSLRLLRRHGPSDRIA
ncbi:putative symporter YagG [compost metagenome]